MIRPVLMTVALLASAQALADRKPAAPPQDPPPDPVKIDPEFRKLVRVFTDGKGHYLMMPIHEFKASPATGNLFYGDGKRFYKLPAPSGGGSRENMRLSVSDPRYPRLGDNGFALDRKKKTAMYWCGKRETILKELPADQAGKMIDAAELRDVFWRRVPHALARDLDGVYYYVDKLPPVDRLQGDAFGDQLPARGHRIYHGRRQQMKPLRMKNIVSDRAGEIFITPGGKLRLVLDRTEEAPRWRASWMAPGKQVELTVLDVADAFTRLLIFNELGVYSGVKLQRPCDVF